MKMNKKNILKTKLIDFYTANIPRQAAVSKQRKTFTRALYLVVLSIFAFSSASLIYGQTEKENQVNRLLEKWFKQDSPGVAAAVVKEGKIVFQHAYGLADLERDVPLTTTSIFDIASNTKQFTAFAILLLAEQGKLSLDDDIRHYFPEFPDYGYPITIRHLLHHTSGLREFAMLLLLGGRRWINHYTNEDIMDVLMRQKSLNNKPGDEYIYSNSGYFLLGLIIQKVSGKNLGDFFRENIFAPLGMNQTYFYDDLGQIIKNRAIGYSPRENGYALEVSLMTGDGSGGILSSLEDLYRWDQNFYRNKLGKGSQEIIKTIFTKGVLNNGETLDYALGLKVGKYKGLKTVSHGGGWNGFRSEILRFPEQEFSVICLANLGTIDPYDIAVRIADIYLVDRFQEEPINDKEINPFALPEAVLKEKAGVYQEPISHRIWTIFAASTGDRLDVKSASGSMFQLVPTGEMEFESLGSPLKFRVVFIKSDPSGYFDMKVTAGDEGSAVFKSVTLQELSSKQLEEYTGAYSSAELNAKYKLFISSGQLMLRVRGLPFDIPLEPTVKDEFVTFGPYLVFVRDQAGKITGFNLSIDGIKNLFLSIE
jgi:CubicO group peptidase (beta-lactamase class C family)